MNDYAKVKEWRSRPGAKAKRAAEARRWRAKHKETAAAIKKRYREKHLEERREIERIAAATKRKADPEGQRIRMERYRQKQIARQIEIAGRPRPDVCELCGELNLRIVFDHCHASGNFRGWLCDRCNKVLGLVKDSPQLLVNLARYLDGSIDDKTPKSAA